jgi:hypothetical protein
VKEQRSNVMSKLDIVVRAALTTGAPSVYREIRGMVEVTLSTRCLLCQHEDDVAQAIGCIVHRLAPAYV